MLYIFAGIIIIVTSAATLRLVLIQARGFGIMEVAQKDIPQFEGSTFYVSSRLGNISQWNVIVTFATLAILGSAAGGAVLCFGLTT